MANIASKLNRLEHAIVAGEDSAEDARWSQAEEVNRLISKGHAQRDIASAWINGRANPPRAYAVGHVNAVNKVWARWGAVQLSERPGWTDAYYTIQQRSEDLIPAETRRQEWSDAHEARAPTSVRTAAKLVENIAKAPKAVRDEIDLGMRQMGVGRSYTPPAERKAREAQGRDEAEEAGRNALAGFQQTVGIVEALDGVVEELRELVEDRMLSQSTMEALDAKFEELSREMEIARAMVGLEVK